MFCDLYLPFPQPQQSSSSNQNNKKKDKGKGKQQAQQSSLAATEERVNKSCWDGVSKKEREEVANGIGMAGHREYR